MLPTETTNPDQPATAAPGNAGSHPAKGRRSARPHTARRSRARLLVPLALLILITGSLAVLVLGSPKKEPPALLGASSSVTGGLARINGIIPLEADSWLPPDKPQVLTGPLEEGMHRVRIDVEVTALDSGGLDFDPTGFAVVGLGSGEPRPVWASENRQEVSQGQSLAATLVFELPDQAIGLSLEAPGGLALSLGTEHHSGG
jgi:hypothetical protein